MRWLVQGKGERNVKVKVDGEGRRGGRYRYMVGDELGKGIWRGPSVNGHGVRRCLYIRDTNNNTNTDTDTQTQPRNKTQSKNQHMLKISRYTPFSL